MLTLMKENIEKGKLTLRLRSGQESDNGCIKYFANKLHCMHSYNSEQITVNSEQ